MIKTCFIISGYTWRCVSCSNIRNSELLSLNACLNTQTNGSPNIYKEGGKLSVHYATFPTLLPYSCIVHKEQNDQIQESDAGASVRVSGQNRACAAVCSMSTILLPGHWCHLVVPFNPTRWGHQCQEFNVGVSQKQELFLEFNVCVFQKQEPKALVKKRGKKKVL